jgi:hypothetical protein
MLVVNNPPGPKMSEALMALLEPEWDDCADEEAMRKLLTLGQIAWNAALMKGAKRQEFLDDMAKAFPSELRTDFKVVVEPLILRKERMFPHIHRMMLNYELSWLPDGSPYVTVLSSLD